MSIQAEARRIIALITKECIDPEIPLGQLLSDGVLLCIVLSTIKTGCISSFNPSPTTKSQKKGNCKVVVKTITKVFKVKCKFSSKDIYEGTKTNKIAKCLVLLVRLWGGNAKRLSYKLQKMEIDKRKSNNLTEDVKQLGEMMSKINMRDQTLAMSVLKSQESMARMRLRDSLTFIDCPQIWKRVNQEGPKTISMRTITMRDLALHRTRSPAAAGLWKGGLTIKGIPSTSTTVVGAYRRMVTRWKHANNKDSVSRSLLDRSLSSYRPRSILIR